MYHQHEYRMGIKSDRRAVSTEPAQDEMGEEAL